MCPETKLGLASYIGNTAESASVSPSSLTCVLSGIAFPFTPASKLWFAYAEVLDNDPKIAYNTSLDVPALMLT
jgi:hypothetical protein